MNQRCFQAVIIKSFIWDVELVCDQFRMEKILVFLHLEKC